MITIYNQGQGANANKRGAYTFDATGKLVQYALEYLDQVHLTWNALITQDYAPSGIPRSVLEQLQSHFPYNGPVSL